MPDASTQTYDAETFARLLISRAPLILALVIVGGIAGYLGAGLQQDEYEAKAVMLVRETPVDARLLNGPWIQAPAANPRRKRSAGVENLEPAAGAAARELGAGVGAEQVLEVVHIEPDLEMERAAIIAVADDPDRAADYANALADSFEQLAREFDRSEVDRALRKARAAREALPEQLLRSAPGRDLRGQVQRLQAVAAVGTNRVVFLKEAVVPTEPQSDETKKTALAGALAGGLLGVGYALLPMLRRRPPGPDGES